MPPVAADDLSAVAASSADAQLARVLCGVAALQKICESMHECVVEARNALRTSGAPQLLSDLDLWDAADTLCSFRGTVPEARPEARPEAQAQPQAQPQAQAPPGKKRRSDVGRKVVVLWVPAYFPEGQTPEHADLAAFRGVVVKHIRVRKGGTHRVQYEDGMCRWHKLDKLVKFLD
jgi:hypothetical protein